MAESIRLHVEVEDDGIIVTLPGMVTRRAKTQESIIRQRAARGEQ
jgi:hypothetical protein